MYSVGCEERGRFFGGALETYVDHEPRHNGH